MAFPKCPFFRGSTVKFILQWSHFKGTHKENGVLYILRKAVLIMWEKADD